MSKEQIKVQKEGLNQKGLEFGRDLNRGQLVDLLKGISDGLNLKIITDKDKGRLNSDDFKIKDSLVEEIQAVAETLKDGGETAIEYSEKGYDLGRLLKSGQLADLLEGVSNGLDIKILNDRFNGKTDLVDVEINATVTIRCLAEKLKDTAC